MALALCFALGIAAGLLSLQYGLPVLTACHVAPFVVLAAVASLKPRRSVEVLASAIAASLPLLEFHIAYLRNSRELDPSLGVLAFTLPVQLLIFVPWTWGLTERLMEIRR